MLGVSGRQPASGPEALRLPPVHWDMTWVTRPPLQGTATFPCSPPPPSRPGLAAPLIPSRPFLEHPQHHCRRGPPASIPQARTSAPRPLGTAENGRGRHRDSGAGRPRQGPPVHVASCHVTQQSSGPWKSPWVRGLMERPAEAGADRRPARLGLLRPPSLPAYLGRLRPALALAYSFSTLKMLSYFNKHSWGSNYNLVHLKIMRCR